MTTEVVDHPVDGLARNSGAPRRSTDLGRRTSLDGPKAAGWNDGYQSSSYFQARGTHAPYDAKNSSHENLTVLATEPQSSRAAAVVRPASDATKPRRSESADLPPGATGFDVAAGQATGNARRAVPGLQDAGEGSTDGVAGAQYYNNARRSRDFAEPNMKRQSSLLDLQEHE